MFLVVNDFIFENSIKTLNLGIYFFKQKLLIH